MVKIHNLSKTYKQHTALDIHSLSIEKGEIVGVLGYNGAGKSTLFHLMLDLIKADSGSIVYKNNHVVTKTQEWKSYTGAFLDDDFLIDFLSPDEYFSFLARLHRLNPQVLSKKLAFLEPLFDGEILETKKLIRELSDGNKQKVGVASAVLHDPEILILDEPFNMLDPRSKIRLEKILVAINRISQATLILSSNILESLIKVCTRVVLLEKGRIILDKPNTYNSLKDVETYFAES